MVKRCGNIEWLNNRKSLWYWTAENVFQTEYIKNWESLDGTCNVDFIQGEVGMFHSGYWSFFLSYHFITVWNNLHLLQWHSKEVFLKNIPAKFLKLVACYYINGILNIRIFKEWFYYMYNGNPTFLTVVERISFFFQSSNIFLTYTTIIIIIIIIIIDKIITVELEYNLQMHLMKM